MTFNRIFFAIIITFTIVCGSVNVNACWGGMDNERDPEFDEALKLDTGFLYSNLPNLHQVKFKELKKLLHVKGIPELHKIDNGVDLIHCDLACGYMHLLLNYFKLSNLKKDNDLDERPIGRMLTYLLKINETKYVTPFWHAYMLVMHSARLRNVTIEKRIKEAKEKVVNQLEHDIKCYCRTGNRYEDINKNNSHLENKERLQNIVKTIYKTQEKNDMLLENEEEKNWTSLESIYMKKIIEDESIWETIIMKFGDQNEKEFNTIWSDLKRNYNNAKMYNYLDHWVVDLRDYQLNVLNIIRTVALDSIRKHSILLKQHVFSSDLSTANTVLRDFILGNNFFCKIFRYKGFEVMNAVRDLTNWSFYQRSKETKYYQLISNVESYMNELSPEFVIAPYEIVCTDEYVNRMNSQNEELNIIVKRSKKDSEKIEEFNKATNVEAIRENFVRIILYFRYLETLFGDYNIETYLSFIRTYKNDSRITLTKPNEKYTIDV